MQKTEKFFLFDILAKVESSEVKSLNMIVSNVIKKNQEANHTNPLWDIAGMRTPITRLNLYDNRVSC